LPPDRISLSGGFSICLLRKKDSCICEKINKKMAFDKLDNFYPE